LQKDKWNEDDWIEFEHDLEDWIADELIDDDDEKEDD